MGAVVGKDQDGPYTAALEAVESLDQSLGLDALIMGNETRCINTYQNIADQPNVAMKRAHVDTYPHVFVICRCPVAVGEEFLFDYGAAYVEKYLCADSGSSGESVAWRELAGGRGSDSSDSD